MGFGIFFAISLFPTWSHCSTYLRFTFQNQNSQEYHGTNEHNKSEAQFIDEIMKYYGNDKNAAMTVNCNDKCQIKRANPTLNTDLIKDGMVSVPKNKIKDRKHQCKVTIN